MSASTQSTDTPEFHIVVRHPNRRGPLAPYRFSLTVLFALAVSGMPLLEATETGVDVDSSLLRTAGSALFAWVVLGRISKILGSSTATRPDADPGSITDT